MTSLLEQKNKIVSELNESPDWESRYKKLIQWGRALPSFPEEKKTNEYLIKGCQSQVWLWAEQNSDGRIIYMADSDALITKGIIALLIKLYSNSNPQEIMTHSLEFFKEIGLMDHLTPSRANGLLSMVKQIKNYALVYSLKNK